MNADGSGLWRSGHSATTPRGMQRFAGLDAPLEKAIVESRLYDPRQRPQYQRALEAKKSARSPIYIDTRTGELVATPAVRSVREKIEQRMMEPLTSLPADVAANIFVSASIGLAIYPDSGPDVSSLLAAADKEMYERKQATRQAI